MTSDPSVAALPTVALAISDEARVAGWAPALAELDVRLERIAPDGSMWERLEALPYELLVVDAQDVSPEVLEQLAARSDDAPGPGVVVLGGARIQHAPTERTRLIAGGVLRVLAPGEDPEFIAQALRALGDAELAGGLDGPEIGGADAQPSLADFLSRSAYMRGFLETVVKVADAEASLLITGETGVGKERLARAIHAESARAEEPFVAVNCGALPENLLESELFGHEKGAFTGAERVKVGRFEEANGGTIFLDEIGEMPAHLQVTLLTVLQRHELRRVGGSEPISLDVRVMAATNRNVQAEVEAGTFREDLYYRLNVVALELPALRERIEDLPDLLGHLIAHFRESLGECRVEGVAPDALAALAAHPWPGNMRELINVIERAVLLAEGEQITLADLPEHIAGAAALPGAPPTLTPKPPPAQPGPATRSAAAVPPTLKEVREAAVREAEVRYLTDLLTETGGVIARTAELAGISTRALYTRLRRYGIDKQDFKP